MGLHCPNCHSKQIGTKNHGKKAGGAIGTAAGGATGSKCGEYVDENILDNYQCLACGYSFNKRKRK